MPRKKKVRKISKTHKFSPETVLITGDRGFVAGYLIPKMLAAGHRVIGVDNDWKYGPIKKPFDRHPRYYHYCHDAKDSNFLLALMKKHKAGIFIHGAAKVGGVSFFRKFAYDILAENERLTAAAFDAAIRLHQEKKLKKIVVISTSMVFENTRKFPSKEGDELKYLPPGSTYGFQKLAAERFARSANLQYGVPYAIVRLFNCAGVGEERAKINKKISTGNIKLAMSHVIPDLIQKIYKGQYPLHILGTGKQVRHYTHGGDIAEGILAAAFSDIINEDFNLSAPLGHTVLQLAEKIWKKMKPGKPLKFIFDEPFEYDVQKSIPDTRKAEKMLGFKAETSLDAILDEVIPWVCKMVDQGRI